MPGPQTLQGLAAQVEQRTAENIAALESQTQQLLAQHAQSLTAAAKALKQQAESEMRSAASARVRQLLPWLGLAGLTGLALMLAAVSAGLSWYATQQAQQIADQRRTLAELRAAGLDLVTQESGLYIVSKRRMEPADKTQDGRYFVQIRED